MVLNQDGTNLLSRNGSWIEPKLGQTPEGSGVLLARKLKTILTIKLTATDTQVMEKLMLLNKEQTGCKKTLLNTESRQKAPLICQLVVLPE